MKNTACLLISALLSFSVSAQIVPTLSKHWKGTSTHTYLNSKSKNKLEKVTVPYTLEVLKQEGRHVLLFFKSSIYEAEVAGTFSADGKQLSLVYLNGEGLYEVNGKSMNGCGTSRKLEKSLRDGDIQTAWCDEFTVVNK